MSFQLAEYVGGRKKEYLCGVADRVRSMREAQQGLYMEDVIRIAGEAFHAGARAMLEGTVERDAAAERERLAYEARLEARLQEHRARMAGFPEVKVLPWPAVAPATGSLFLVPGASCQAEGGEG
jgi:hypothetical protein